MKTSHKSAFLGEQISFSGKLTDRNGNGVSGATIIIWETDDGKVQQIAETKTNARGEYRATTTAQYWDGVGNSVEVYAFSPVGSVKSVTISINIDKPYAGQNFESTVSTDLHMYIEEENVDSGIIQLFPQLTGSGGNLISSNLIKIYVNGDFYQTVSANKWTDNIYLTPGTYTFKVDYPATKVGSTTYESSSSSFDYKIYEPKQYVTSTPQVTPSQKTTTTSETSNDNLYKTSAENAKSSYWNAIQMLYDGLKKSEDSLSGLIFENSDAQKKIETAWSIRTMSLDSLENARGIMYSSDSFLNNGNYELAYSKMKDVDKYIDSINSDLTAITSEIKNGKKLENEHLERTKFCFLFWCDEVKKLDYVDVRVKDIELEIQKIMNKKEVLRSDYEVLGLQKKANEQLTIKQQALEAEQLAKQKKEQELVQKQQQLEDEQLAKQKKEQELAHKQKQLELETIEKEKESILADYSWSPFIMGLTDGELTYYVQPLPSYSSQDVRIRVEELADWMDGKTMYQGTKLKRVYDYGYSDFSINWVKDYQEEAIGRQIGNHLIVGLGTSNCHGDWMPFNGYTVYKIMWHEVGHALGYAHVSDSNNIMYEKGTGNNFDLEYKESITLPDGYWQQIYLCHGGSFAYSTVKKSQGDGYKVYVVPPDSNPRDVINHNAPVYLDCSAYENTMRSAADNCTVESGSYLLIYNPSSFGIGDAVTVSVEIYDRNTNKQPNFDFDESHMFFSKDYIDYVKTLFRN